MAVKFLGYEINGQLRLEPPPELVERTTQVFLSEYDLRPAEKNAAELPAED